MNRQVQHKTTILWRAAMALLAMMIGSTASWGQTTQTVSYIDANGQTQSVTATVLTGNESSLGSIGTTTWYVVNSNITHSGRINYNGNVNIILADGCMMTTSTDNKDGIHGYSSSTLTIYGQTLGTGTLAATGGGAGNPAIYSSDGDIIINGGNVTASATSPGTTCISIGNGSFTINGGNVTATATGSSSQGIFGGTVTINGGTVTASGTSTGISANWGSGTITLGWTNATDQIHASSYSGTVNIADGKALKNGGTVYYGTLTSAQKSAIANVTLQPATQAEFIAAALPQTGTNEYTIYDSVGWNALCDALQDNDTWNRFSGDTVKLGADITVTRMAGSSHCDFCGIFDGQGHTLTVNIHSDNEHEYTAPFSYISEDTPTGGSEVSHPAIRNLNVAGTVTATKNYAGGIVGAFWATLTIENCSSSVTINTNNKHAAGFIGYAAGNATITNCLSSVTINSSVSGDGTHAGFIGGSHSGTTFTIEGCAFTGKLLTSNGTNRCAGFVGYNSGTLTITNSLYAPDSVNVGATESATFARNWTMPSDANCYYTATLGTAQGKALHTVTAGTNVTIDAIALTGSTTSYNVSGITAYSNGGLALTVGDEQTLYYGSDDQVSLTLSNNAPVPPTGYLYSYTASAGTLGGNDNPYTLTMPDEDVTINLGDLRSDGQNHPVTYMKADGTTATQEAIALDETMTWLDGQWYYVGKDIDYTRHVHLEATNIIFGDGTTMNIGTSERPLSDNSIDVHTSFTTYGQSLDVATAGHLNIYGTQVGIYSNGAYNQNGGNVTINITGTGTFQNGIMGNSAKISGGTLNITTDDGDGIDVSSITIEGGQVDVHAGGDGKYGLGRDSYTNITLGWTNADDHINANSYRANHVSIAEGKALSYTSGGTRTVLGPGELTDDQITAIAGKNLVPVIPVSYTAANGNTTNCYDYTELTGGGATTLAGGWYYVSGTVDITGTLTLDGDVTLILADGATLNIGTEQNPINSGNCIKSVTEGFFNAKYSLTIYGQSTDPATAGTLNAYGSDRNSVTVYVKNYTQHGGNVTIDATQNSAIKLVGGNLTLTRGNLTAKAGQHGYAIDIDDGYSATVSGGTLNASGPANAIWGGTLALSGSATATINGRIDGDVALSGSATATINGGIWGDVVIADGQAFEDAGGHYYSGTLTDSEKAAISGQTLTRLTSLPIAEEQYVWHAIVSPMMDNADGTIVAIRYVDYCFRSINTPIDLIDLYRYNEVTATWENIVAHFNPFGLDDFRTLDPGRGYIVRHSSPTAPWLESDREQNIHYEDCTVTLTATTASGALKGFNLIGNPFIRPIPCERPYYSLNPDGIWQAHPDGGTLAIGQAVLVHTETDGEQLTITPTTGIAGNGSKSLPPLPRGFSLSGGSDQSDQSDLSDQQPFAYQQGDQLVITLPGHLEAYDALGRLLFSKELNSFPSALPTSLFPGTGVYLLRLDEKSQKIVIF